MTDKTNISTLEDASPEEKEAVENIETKEVSIPAPEGNFDVSVWEVDFVAEMRRPIRNVGQFFYDKGASRQEALKGFIEWLADQDIYDPKIATFNEMEDADVELQMAEAPTTTLQ